MGLTGYRSASIELSPVEMSLGEIFAPDRAEDRHLSTEAKERRQLGQVMAMLEVLNDKCLEEERVRNSAQEAMQAAKDTVAEAAMMPPPNVGAPPEHQTAL